MSSNRGGGRLVAAAALGLLLISAGRCRAGPHGHMHARGELPAAAEGSLRGAMDALLSRQRQMSAAAGRQYSGESAESAGWMQPQQQQDYGNAVEEMQYYPSRFDKTPAYPYFDRESGSTYRQSQFRDHSNWNQPDKRGTAFRERMSGIKTHPRDELAELFLKNIEEDEARDRQRAREQQRNEEYEEMVEDMFQKYHGKDYDDPEQDLARIFGGRNEVKRQLAGDYQPVGWGPIGYRKRTFRDRYEDDVSENDLMRALKYIPTEALERLLAEEEAATNDLQVMNQQPHHGNYEMYPGKELNYWRNPQNMRKKRFPVTKRSNVFVGNKKKRSSDIDKPSTEAEDKIAKDLSSIFGTKSKKEKNEDKKTPVKKSAKQTKVVVEKHNGTDGHDHTHYGEVFKLDQVLPEKPVEIKKKAVDWSDYFGIDKRSKKSAEDREDWIKHRYLANSMREYNDMKQQEEYPLKSFKHHDMDKKYQPFDTRVFDQGREQVLDARPGDYEDVDDKLKDIEDILLDEAAKYTEAREADPEEINQLRQMVVSRLSEMYGNERTHQPATFRSNFPERSRMGDFVDDKAKRVAVKKESAEPAHNETVDDKVKRGNENQNQNQRSAQEPYSEGYMGGRIGMHHGAEMNECPIVQSIAARCRNIDVWAGDRGQLFLPLCSMHQICYLCGPTIAGGCDLLFLSEADAVCSEERECRRAARDALALMRELHAVADPAAECARHPCLADYKRKR